MEIKSDFLVVNDRSIHVRIYNPDGEKTVICWHGLARNGFDFEILAQNLGKTHRVLCPDALGRGLSQWAKKPTKEYDYPNYLAIAMGICDYFAVKQMDWIGTSMGGIIGMLLAAGPCKDRIQRLVINDIGPEVPKDALIRIIEYVSGKKPLFDTFVGYRDYLKQLYGTGGQRTSDQWIRMTQTSLRRNNRGQFTVHYDPEIILKSDENVPVIDLWEPFCQVTCPILLFHGVLSDVLTRDIVERMRSLKPQMLVTSIEDCGHAPGLHLPGHIAPILKFLA
ncbi:MAG: alpha/beta hydrolase [Desulfobacteraceae bacterium]|nr:alpha/beta hydrolase [Desulfobacteraceae bacterium]